MVVRKLPMLHTKFHSHRSIYSGDKDFYSVCYMGMVAILIYYGSRSDIFFHSPRYLDGPLKTDSNRSSGF